MLETQIPILRSSAVLRAEYFGGYLLNHFLPPEMTLDRIRFQIACMCNGDYTLREIKEHLADELSHSREYIDHLVEETLRRFENNLLLSWENEKLPKPCDFKHLADMQIEGRRHLSAPLGLIWELTRACNLKCKHCFSDSGRPGRRELTTEEIKTALDRFADRKVFYINFTGGEPLLRSDLLEILRYASDKKISIDLSTNGFLVSAEMVELLQQTNVFQVQVSLDGIGDSHDNFRGVKGSFQRALDAIQLLRQANFDVAISTSVTKNNIGEVSKLIDLSINAGASVFKTTLFIPTGRGKLSQQKLSLDSDDVRQLALLMAAKEKEVSGRIVLEKDGSYPWLLEEDYTGDPAWMRSPKVGCAAGTSSLFITADGDVTPCPFLRSMVIGNLLRTDFSEIWESGALSVFRILKRDDLKGKCKNCEYLGNQCYGGCRAAALAYNNDLYSEDPLCWKGNRDSTSKVSEK